MTHQETTKTRDIERRVLRVLDYIHDNPTGDLSLDALADVAAMSRFHWHRVYRAVIGETVAQTVRRRRLHLAAIALVQSDQPVPRIAESVGYDNPASFNRTFKDLYGVSPKAFRDIGVLRAPVIQMPTGDTIMDYPIEIREEPARRLAAMPHEGAYHEVNRAFERLAAVVGSRGLFPQAGHMVGVFYDDPSSVAEAELRSHAGLEMPDEVALDEPLETLNLPSGRHAVLRFTGPYVGLAQAYEQLYSQWLPASGEAPADHPSFEVYLNSPMDTAPDDLVTEICLPLA